MGIATPNVIPSTTNPGFFFVSVGDGTGRGYWLEVNPGSGTNADQLQGTAISPSLSPSNGSLLMWSTSGTPEWVAVAAPTVGGQILFWNGTAWVQNSTTAPSDTDFNVWNSSSSEWVPVALSGDVTMNHSGVASVVKINGNAVASGTPSNGSMLVWNTTGTPAWVAEMTPTTTGQVPTWDSVSGLWVPQSPPSPSGTAWGANVTSGSVGTGGTGSPTGITGMAIAGGVTGYHNYLITYTATMASTNAATSGSIGILFNGSLVGPVDVVTMRGTAGDIYQFSLTFLVTGQTPATSYSVQGAAIVGAGTGTYETGSITVLGVS